MINYDHMSLVQHPLYLVHVGSLFAGNWPSVLKSPTLRQTSTKPSELTFRGGVRFTSRVPIVGGADLFSGDIATPK